MRIQERPEIDFEVKLQDEAKKQSHHSFEI